MWEELYLTQTISNSIINIFDLKKRCDSNLQKVLYALKSGYPQK